MISLCDVVSCSGAAGFVIKVVVVNACLVMEIRVTDQDGSVKFLRWQEKKLWIFLENERFCQKNK